MRKLRIHIVIGVILVLCGLQTGAQELLYALSGESEINPPEGEPEEREGSADSAGAMSEMHAFHVNLIPCAHLYDHVWDSLNVDVPAFSKADVEHCITLPLTDSDCGYVHPFLGVVNSDFGWRRYRMHKGIDIGLNTGDSIFAAFDGVVRISKYNYGGFGHYVLIRHYNGVETLYGHLSKRLVEPNTVVRAGELIGLGGNTGRSTGPHLHFEMRYRGQALNPNKVIDFETGSLWNDTLQIDMEDYAYLFDNGWIYTPVKTDTTSDGEVYHTLRRGDTLYALSKKYNTTVQQICKLNGISTRTTLRVGREIRIL